MPRIELETVSKLFPGGDGLAETTLTIDAGSFTALLGPSGSGKSTFIRLLAGLESPDTGEICFDGEDMAGVSPARRGVGLVVAHGALYEHKTAHGNIEFPLLVSHVEKETRASKVLATAKRFGVGRILPRASNELSSGERQLVATSRAAVRGAGVLLLDEALASVDPHRKDEARMRIRELHAGGATVVFATNHQEEAMSLATSLVVLDRGVVQQVGPPVDLYHNPANVFVAQFVGSPGMNVFPVEVLEPGRVRIGTDEVVLPTPPTRTNTMLLGVRPEHVVVAPPGTPYHECFTGRVTHIENLGSHRDVHLAFGGPERGSLDFAIRMSDASLTIGDPIELTLKPGHVKFFDPVTEHAVLDAPTSS